MNSVSLNDICKAVANENDVDYYVVKEQLDSAIKSADDFIKHPTVRESYGYIQRHNHQKSA